VKYAKLAGAAYCSSSSLQSWSCGSVFCSEAVTKVKVCQGAPTKPFVGLWESKGLVSFQGTHGVAAMIQDLKIVKSGSDWPECSGCKLHSGFLDEWNSLKACVQTSLTSLGGKTVRTTGHSLGAALSIIAAVDLHYQGFTIEESYDFGRPRTGSVEFAHASEALFGNNVNRVTHQRDPVVQLPPDKWGIISWHYEHSAPEAFFDGADSVGVKICSDVHDKTCSAKYWDVLIDNLNVNDHLKYMDIPIAGCSAFEEGMAAANHTIV